MTPRKLSIEVLLDPRNLLPPTIDLHHMEGRLAPHGGEVSASSDPSEDKISSGSPLGSPEGSSPEQKAPTVFIRSRDEENPSGSKPMPTFDPSDLIGRTFLLPPEENGERHRAKVTRQVVEIIDQGNGQRVENMNFI